ncbi:MAG: hypothetical protein HKN80_13065, partial [Acidimicrobiia bacterium]|nr:hypothetical protein [Acidimicrobiia bacterium]
MSATTSDSTQARSIKIGLPIPHTGSLASPEFVRDYCVTAEEVGFDGLWAVDHLVMPQHTDSLYTLARKPALTTAPAP